MPTTSHTLSIEVRTVDFAKIEEALHAIVENRRYSRSSGPDGYTAALEALSKYLDPKQKDCATHRRTFNYGTDNERTFTVDPRDGTIQFDKGSRIIKNTELARKFGAFYSDADKQKAIDTLSEFVRDFKRDIEEKGLDHDPKAIRKVIYILRLSANEKVGLIDPKIAAELIKQLQSKGADQKTCCDVLEKLEKLYNQKNDVCTGNLRRQYGSLITSLRLVSASSSAKTTSTPTGAVNPVFFVPLPQATPPKPDKAYAPLTGQTDYTLKKPDEESSYRTDTSVPSVANLLDKFGSDQEAKHKKEENAKREEEEQEQEEKTGVRRALAKYRNVREGDVQDRIEFKSDAEIEAYVARLDREIHRTESEKERKEKEIPHPRPKDQN